MTRPDFNADPEIQVLNELLWSTNDAAVAFVLDALREDDFYNPLHGQVFTAIKDTHARGHGRDAVSVNSNLLNNYDELGIRNPHIASHLLVNIAVLATPQHNLKGNAHTVLADSYRRRFEAMADALKFASQEAPADQLFDILVNHGKKQRTVTERLTGFSESYDAAADESPPAQRTRPEDSTPLERIQTQLHTRDASTTSHPTGSSLRTNHNGQELEL